jgi:hypothetical protein
MPTDSYDPIPEAVRALRHTHTIPSDPNYLGGHTHFGYDPGHDQGAAMFAAETRERAFWLGLREVLREEVTLAERDLKTLAYALFRSNIDWAEAARTCGDSECHGDCRHIADIRRIVGRWDGGILPGGESQ